MYGYAALVVQVADAMSVRQFDLVGQYTGASIAMQTAADWPCRVRRLVLWGVPMFPPDKAARLANMRTPPLRDDASGLVDHVREYRSNRAGLDLEEEAIRSDLLEILQCGRYRHWAANAVGQTDHAALAARIAQPTLLINGAGDSRYESLLASGWAIADATLRAVPLIRNGRYKAVIGAYVNLTDEAAAAFAATAASFLYESERSEESA